MKVQRIKDFLEGKSDPAEVHEIIKWIHGEDSKQAIEDELHKSEHDFELKKDESERLYESIQSKIHQYSQNDQDKIDNVRSIPKAKNPFTFKRLMMVVAASFALLLVGYSVFHYSVNEQIQEVVAQTSKVIKKADLGQKLTIQLNDGSVIKLNAGSTMEYDPATFSENRYVEIHGEAFFEIAKDEARPFRVNADDLFTVEVLGTKFNINTYSHLLKKTVTLTEGKVQVNQLVNEEGIQLVPGEQFSLNSEDGSFEKRQVDTQQYTSWKDGVLFFNREPIGTVFQKLSYWYGVTFEFQGDLIKGDCRLDGEFNNQPLSLVLKSIASVYDFEYEINDNMVKIRGDTCH